MVKENILMTSNVSNLMAGDWLATYHVWNAKYILRYVGMCQILCLDVLTSFEHFQGFFLNNIMNRNVERQRTI